MEEFVNKIKEKGYWRILIRPNHFNNVKVQDIKDLSRLIEQTEVRLRGWYYPHYGRENRSVGKDYIQSFCDYTSHKEFWRFYQSSQFIHYRAIREDYEFDYSKRRPLSINEPSPTNKYLEILITLYTITEVLEFAARLANKDIYDDNIYISISLNDLYDRQLFFYDDGRDLWGNYRSKENELEFEKTFNTKDFITNHNQFAVDAAYWFFQRFNWTACPKGLLKEEQNKLIERRL